jgi:hypothetical protein
VVDLTESTAIAPVTPTEFLPACEFFSDDMLRQQNRPASPVDLLR